MTFPVGRYMMEAQLNIELRLLWHLRDPACPGGTRILVAEQGNQVKFLNTAQLRSVRMGT